MRYYFLGISLAAAICSPARELTPEQAYDRLQTYAKTLSARALTAPAAPSPLFCEKGAYYIFPGSSGNGFIIAAADDRVRPLLGYSDSGSFNPKNIPDNMKGWLDGYAAEIAALPSSPDIPVSPTQNYSGWSAVNPLVTTKWDQMEPYWNDCPMSGNDHCVTGCVATAMAQIVNYHRHFIGHGVRSLSKRDVTIDYENTTIDFSLLLDRYDDSSPEDSKSEVAKLMLACGVAVDMDYSPYVSGAMSEKVPAALCTNMGYDSKSTCRLERTDYTTDEWESLIYNELQNSRPVYYSGTASEGGHAFICDGYGGDGLFHFNWGWSGMSDGYFALTALAPSMQGTGSYEGGYNFNQAIVLVSPTAQKADLLQLKGGISIDSRTGVMTFRYTPAALPEDTDVDLGYIIEDEQGNPMADDKFSTFHFSLGTNRTEEADAGICPPLSADGAYRIYPVFRRAGDTEWRKTCRHPRYAPYIAVEITDGVPGNLKEVYPENRISLQSEDKEINLGTDSRLRFTAANLSAADFNEPSGIAFYNMENKLVARLNLNGYENSNTGQFYYSLTIPAYSNTTVAVPLLKESVPAGDYTVYLMDSRKEIASGGLALTITDRSLSTPDFGNITCLNINDMPDIIEGSASITWQMRIQVKEAAMFTPGYTFYEPDTDNIVLHTEAEEAVEMEPRTYLSFTLPETAIPLDFGIYDMVVTDKEQVISPRHRVKVSGTEAGMHFIPGDAETEVTLTSASSTDPELSVPTEATINSKRYTVSAIGANSLSYHTGLQSLTVPSTVTSIGTDALRGCYALRHLFIEAETPAFSSLLFAAPMLSPDLAVYTNADCTAAFRQAVAPYSLYARMEGLSGPASITIGENHEYTMSLTPCPASPEVNPAVMLSGTDCILLLDSTIGEDGMIYVRLKGVSRGEGTLHLSSVQPGIEPLEIKWCVTEDTGIDPVADESGITEWWSIDGKPLHEEPTGHGIYIRRTGHLTGRIIK